MSKIFLFETIKFSICTQFSSIGLYLLLPLLARVDLGAIWMKGYFTIMKYLALLELQHQIVLCHIQHTHWVSLTLGTYAVSVFYSPYRVSQIPIVFYN